MWELARGDDGLQEAVCEALKSCALSGGPAVDGLMPQFLATVGGMLATQCSPQCFDVLKVNRFFPFDVLFIFVGFSVKCVSFLVRFADMYFGCCTLFLRNVF